MKFTPEQVIDMAREAGFATGTMNYFDGNGSTPFIHPLSSNQCMGEVERLCTLAADRALEPQAARIAELEAAHAGIMQAITDPENQPSQYGTVTIDMHAEDGFVIERMGQLLAETVLILRGPPPKLTRWSYHNIPEQVAALKAERDTLRAEVERLRTPLTDEQIDALLPMPDGSAEANVTRVEVSPGIWGTEHDEVDAWSKPLVRQLVRAIEAAKEAK